MIVDCTGFVRTLHLTGEMLGLNIRCIAGPEDLESLIEIFSEYQDELRSLSEYFH